MVILADEGVLALREAGQMSTHTQDDDFLPWSDAYRTGFADIDSDHQRLFHLVNRLHAMVESRADNEDIGEAFAALNDYIEEHFEREEQFLRRNGYPDLKDHQYEHIALCWKIRDLEREFHASPKYFEFDDFLRFMEEWLIDHILERDMSYAAYFHHNGGPTTSMREPSISG